MHHSLLSNKLMSSFFVVVVIVFTTSFFVKTVAASPDYSTPEKLAMALANGEIDQDTVYLYLAYAFGNFDRVPEKYRGTAPWEGTLVLRELYDVLQKGEIQTDIQTEMERLLLNGFCGPSIEFLPTTNNTTNFHIEYYSVGGGLTIQDYADTLETSWSTEIGVFGWAAPPVLSTNPAPGDRYHVRIIDISNLPGPGGIWDNVLGFVTNEGAHAGFVGDNPNTSWADGDAAASCMVLDSDYSEFSFTPLALLQAVVAHEFNHSLQFGYGALDDLQGIAPGRNFTEGGATWMEDEVFDSANDNYNYLDHAIYEKSMAAIYVIDNLDDEYAYWIVFRGLTERFGTGYAGGGENIMQVYWENISKGTGNSDIEALENALVSQASTSLGAAYHDFAIASKFFKACGTGNYVYPYCFEEGSNYVAALGNLPPDVHGIIQTVPGVYNVGTISDSYALNWVRLPNNGPYRVRLSNTSSGGQLRTSVVCDTGTQLLISPLALANAGQTRSLNYYPSGCQQVVAVITNQSTQSAETPRSYTLELTNISAPTPTNTSAPTNTPTATMTPSPTSTPTATMTPSPTSTPSPTPTGPTPTPSPTFCPQSACPTATTDPSATATFVPSPTPSPTITPTPIATSLTPTATPVYACSDLHAPPNGPFLVAENLLFETYEPGEWVYLDFPFSGYARHSGSDYQTTITVYIEEEYHTTSSGNIKIHFPTDRKRVSYWLAGVQYSVDNNLSVLVNNGDGSGILFRNKYTKGYFAFDTIQLGFGTKSGYQATHLEVSRLEISNLCDVVPPTATPTRTPTATPTPTPTNCAQGCLNAPQSPTQTPVTTPTPSPTPSPTAGP